MIRRGKDKVDERFNILEDGTIVDLNGNVQELSIYQERYKFLGTPVHKIQMWTNYGYRDTKIWDIHHLDKNPLNNSLSNLVYLTKNEHISLHMKGKHLSEEHRKKISNSMKGKNHPLYGKHWTLSEEARRKISERMKGNSYTKGKKLSKTHKQKLSVIMKEMKWFNDGIKSYRCKECPPGCVEGRIKWKN